MGDDVYDVIIVGGGPAGLAAGLYTARDRYRTLILERLGLPGGQIMLTEHVENYPGWELIAGPDLIQNQRNQAEKFGAEILSNQNVDDIRRRNDGMLEVVVNGGEKNHLTRAVILSPGSDYRQLGVPGEGELRQAGKVSYCATCDGAFFRDKDVLCVGGGNTALQDAVYLASRFTRKTTLIHRRREFRAQKILVEQLEETAKEKNIDIKLPYVLEEIVGSDDNTQVDHVRIKNVETHQTEDLKVDGVFMFVGMNPNTGFLRGIVDMNEAGYITCDPLTMKTSTPGVFVAGDCRQQAPMQLVTACADGVVAALQLKEYFRDPDSWAKGTKEERVNGW